MQKLTLCRHAAAHKPVVLLRGVNHAQLSNGTLREGDLDPEQDAAGATAEAAVVLGDFVAAHMSPERCRPGRSRFAPWARTANMLLMYSSRIQVSLMVHGTCQLEGAEHALRRFAPSDFKGKRRRCSALTRLTGMAANRREVRRAAVDRLLEHCTGTAAWLSPYTAALGACCRTPSRPNPAFTLAPLPCLCRRGCCVVCQDLTVLCLRLWGSCLCAAAKHRLGHGRARNPSRAVAAGGTVVRAWGASA